ncbi:PREDICTED: ankyrin-2-like [Amphimedon queenslandica]|uniref:Uncharacterized protein n=1 Tax=Amphimedon queenslandica TaxID=400682 RepID=A0A1X7VTC0_AMPQE|nr:PREDICTED: ankyrin-2-like [Amphimedon queenslandica]|eukprot:XP_019854767.1 PREDICTED: ankyrin-2-like [Amphimedon queenslandica]
MFASLVFNIEKALKNEADFDDVLSFSTNYLRDRFEPQPLNIRQLFNCLQPYYCFINYKILKVVVSVFVEEAMEKNMRKYHEAQTKWLKSTTIQEFKEAVEKAASTEAVDPSPNQCLIVLRLEGEWLKVKLNHLWRLLEHLFGKESSILTKLTIKEGSALVCLFAPQSEILSLLILCSKKYNELFLLSIQSIQFGNILLSVSYYDWRNPFRLDLNLIGAINYFKIHKSLSLIRCLLDIGADPNKEIYLGNEGMNSLIFATTLNNTEVMSLLVEYGANVHKFIGPEGRSAIHLAAAAGYAEALEFLLRKGVSPDHRLPSINGTPLMLASFHQHRNIILLLLKNGANLDIQNKNGISALAGACDNGRYSMAKLLLEKGANPNLQTIEGHTALALSCIRSKKEIVKLLLDFNADPNIPLFNGFTPLMLACQNKDYMIVKLLLQAGVSVDTQNDSFGRKTALHIATILNNTQLVRLLLAANADINIQDTNGITPIAYACEQRNKEMVECCLKNKANPNICDENGKFPLNIAVAKNEIEITAALLNAGADPNIGIGNESEATLLHWACVHSNNDIVHLLLKANANPNAVTTEGHTPLNTAASMGCIKVAEMLLSEGADIEFEDTLGWTPIFYAAAGGESDMISFLLKHGAKIKKDKFGGTIESVAAIVGGIEIKGLLQEATKKQSEKKDEATVSKEQERKDEPKEVTSTILITPVEVTSTALTTPVEVDTESSEETTKPSPLINEDDQQSTDNSYSHFQKIRTFISSSIGSIKQQYYDNTIKQLEYQMEAMKSTIAEQLKLLSIS